MELIRDIYRKRRDGTRPIVSFEVFPPKTEEGDRNLLQRTVPSLMAIRPDYCSVTYGAGGSTREKTVGIVGAIQKAQQLTCLAHLTCVNHTRDQVGELLARFQALDCHNLLALRGDPPPGTEFQATSGGFKYAAELVEFIRGAGDFSIGVAGFPEGHIACKTGKHDDWNHLAAKVKAGADFVLTQLFFDNADFFEFRDYLSARGVNVPIIPGMIAILSASQIKKFTQMCGARIPAKLGEKLDQLGEDDAATAEFGIEYATRQCQELLDHGVPGIHFYSLNKSASTIQVVKNLGLM